MTVKQFLKSKTIREYLDAQKEPEIMAKIEERSVSEVLKNTAKSLGKKAVTIHCPYCQSMDVQYMRNTKKALSAPKAIGGAIVTLPIGGVGVLAGFVTKKGKNQWLCESCHRTFMTKEKK